MNFIRRHLQTFVLASLLAGVGLSLVAYKATVLDLPLTPGDSSPVWTIEERFRVNSPEGGPVRVEQPVPGHLAGHARVSEEFIATTFSAVVEGEAEDRRAIWTARRMQGEETLYYRLQVVASEGPDRSDAGLPPSPPPVPDYREPFGTAAQGLLAEVRRHSADVESFARLLVRRYHEAGDRSDLLRERAATPAEHAANLKHILAGARIPARVSWALVLQDEVRAGELTPWLEVYHAEGWFAIDPRTGAVGLPRDQVMWLRDRSPRIEVDGGRVANRSFAITRTERDLLTVAEQRADTAGSLLLDLTLFDLPLQTQQVLQLILIVPIGALVVVVMRNVVGVATFGTFMPVLMALAFRETQLLLGVTLFTGIVALALAVRFYLERLHLLLVPRLGVVLTTVVLIMLALALASHRLGMDQALSVALFPMVILAMVVERMSLIWEEAGPQDAIQQALGSLLVAAIAYVLMNQPLLRHLVFVFPESLLCVMAVMLLFGRYTGYRLAELWRFRDVLLRGERWG